MSYLTQLLGLSNVANDQISSTSDEVSDLTDIAKQGTEHVGTAIEFLNKTSEKLRSNGTYSFSEAIEEATPWLGHAADVIGEALPPIKAAAKLIGIITKETDPRALGLLAFSLAYQDAMKCKREAAAVQIWT